jgi:hypothetical protein
MVWFYKLWGKLTGKNLKDTPVEVITDQMLEMRALPIGRAEFEVWSDRIISGALIPGVTEESSKFALADQIMHLGPTEDHKPDIFFIKTLRKFAVNQTADEMRREIRDKAKARLAAQEEAAKVLLGPVLDTTTTKKTSEVTHIHKGSVTDVKVANEGLSSA